MFKYPKVFQCDSRSEFESDMTKLLEKHNADIRRATTKYKHTHTVFVKVFNKDAQRDVQELQDSEKASTIFVKTLNIIVNKKNNTKSLMIDMKSKDAIQHDISLVNNIKIKKDELLTLSGAKIHLG